MSGRNRSGGAILVSALTTVMVFIPILVMQLEAGQLFRDIAVAISVSVLLSLVVAVTVIPALSSRLLKGGETKKLGLPGIDHFGARLHLADDEIRPVHGALPYGGPRYGGRHRDRSGRRCVDLFAQAGIPAGGKP